MKHKSEDYKISAVQYGYLLRSYMKFIKNWQIYIFILLYIKYILAIWLSNITLKMNTFLPEVIINYISEYDQRWNFLNGVYNGHWSNFNGIKVFMIAKNDIRYTILNKMFTRRNKYLEPLRWFDALGLVKESTGSVIEISSNETIKYFHFHLNVMYYINNNKSINKMARNIYITSFISDNTSYTLEEHLSHPSIMDDIIEKVGFCHYEDYSRLYLSR